MSCRCDQCGVEGAKSAFKYCAACREAIYCSPECQRTHWKAGHKHKCVKQNTAAVAAAAAAAATAAAAAPLPPPPPIAVGAAVVISGIVSQPSLNGSRGSVAGGPDPETGRWAVRCAVDGKSRQLKPANLEVLLGAGARRGGGGGGGGASAAADGEEECAICLDALQQPQTLPCGHRFCRGCVTSMRERGVGATQVCPLCRGPMPDADRMHLKAAGLLAQHERWKKGQRAGAPLPPAMQDLLSKAGALCREALAIDPEHALGHHLLGNILRAGGDVDGATSQYRRALVADPQCAPGHYSLGVNLGERGDKAGSETAFRAAAAADPQHAWAHFNVGRLLQERGDFAGSEAAYRAAIAADQQYVKAHVNMGALLVERGDYVGAEAAFRAAFAIDPQDVMAHLNMGNLLCRRGDPAGAARSFEAVLKWAPEGTPVHAAAKTNLAASRHNMGVLRRQR